VNDIKIYYEHDVDEESRKIVRNTITNTFTLGIIEGQLDIDIEKTYNRSREQYNAEKILEMALNKYSGRPILVIVPWDIYVPGLNFVFGVAIPNGGAVIGLERFRWGGGYVERVIKTVRHELGHVFGLRHCNNPCVMRFANSLMELDQKPMNFCPECKNKLKILGVLMES